MQSGVPITPKDIASFQEETIPAFVIDIFNEMIRTHYRNGESCFYVQDVKDRLKSACLERAVACESRFLWVDSIFEKHGWRVECESWQKVLNPMFTFTPKERLIGK